MNNRILIMFLMGGVIFTATAMYSEEGVDVRFGQKSYKDRYLPLPEHLKSLTSKEGQELLAGNIFPEKFWSLITHYECQRDLTSCGPASAVMALNAAGYSPSGKTPYDPLKLYTQSIFLNGKNIPNGMTLKDMADTFQIHNVNVDIYYASDFKSKEDFRLQLIDSLENGYVLANYLRKVIGEESGGHFSPIGGYNADKDMFLILDVSYYKYPPVWVKSDLLYEACKTIDSDSKKSRGFVVLHDKQ